MIEEGLHANCHHHRVRHGAQAFGDAAAMDSVLCHAGATIVGAALIGGWLLGVVVLLVARYRTANG